MAIKLNTIMIQSSFSIFINGITTILSKSVVTSPSLKCSTTLFYAYLQS